MAFGSNSPKFPLGRVGFDGHPGLGGPVAGGMVPNEMVMYPVEESLNDHGVSVVSLRIR